MQLRNSTIKLLSGEQQREICCIKLPVDHSSVSCKKQKNIGVAIQYTGTETKATERDFGYSMFLLLALALSF